MIEKELGNIAQILAVDLFLLCIDFKHGNVAVAIDFVACNVKTMVEKLDFMFLAFIVNAAHLAYLVGGVFPREGVLVIATTHSFGQTCLE